MDGPALLVDAGPLYAYADAGDAAHAACRELLETYPGPVIAPILAVGEATYLLARRLRPRGEAAFLGDLATGSFVVESVKAADWLRIAELVLRYRDLPLGTADASIVAAAERLGTVRIATLDHRHFSVLRPLHAPAFDLLP